MMTLLCSQLTVSFEHDTSDNGILNKILYTTGVGVEPNVYERMDVSTYIRTYVCTGMRAYMSTYVHTHIRTYLRTHAETQLVTYMHTDIRPHVCKYVHAYAPEHLPTYARAHENTYARRRIRQLVREDMQTGSYTVWHTHTLTLFKSIQISYTATMAEFPEHFNFVYQQSRSRARAFDISKAKWSSVPNTRIFTYASVYARVYARTYACMRILRRIHMCIRPYVRMYSCLCLRAYIHLFLSTFKAGGMRHMGLRYIEAS